eukprot:7317811-Karenia_brevis.AAC.1
MEAYVDEKLALIEAPGGFLSNTEEWDETWMNKIGSNGRPDAAAGHTIIAGEYKHKSPQLIAMCNQVVKQCKGMKVHHRVWHIKPWDIRL